MAQRGRGGYGGSSSYRGNNSRGWGGSDSRSRRGGSSRILNSSYGSSTRGGGGSSNFSISRSSDRNIGGRYWSGSSQSNANTSSFESRSRYASNESSLRYSSSTRSHGEDSFKRPYRSESYGSRDLSSHRSPERKRIRSEVQGNRSPRGLNSRRSHESGTYAEYNGSSSHRYETSGGSGGGALSSRYSSERRSSFAQDRHHPPPSSSSISFRPPPPPSSHRSHDDYRSKPSASSSPRGGSYRGGRLNSRGLIRREALFSSARRRPLESSFSSRSRAIRSSEHVRKLKLARLRSAASRRALLSARKFRSRVAAAATVRSQHRSEKKEEEDWDEEIREAEEKVAATVAAEKKKSDEKSDNEKSKKSPKVNGESSPSPHKKDEKKIDKDDAGNSSDTEPRSRFTGRRFIRLTCVHCSERCVTFKEYSQHLQRSRHLQAMRRVAVKQKLVLSRMRTLQRTKQRDLDKDDENSSTRKNFCLLCKLNYKQMKAVHQSSEAHKEMKRFLMPFCKICRITFRSPMLYESHMCSLEHIKRKAQLDADEKARGTDGTGSGNEEGGLNLDNFLTLDSVGDVDDEEANESDKPVKQKSDDEKSKSKKESINVGHDYIRKIEVLYCDLCRTYLTSAASSTSEEKRAAVIKVHCRARAHLKRYVRKTKDNELRETAERIHRSNVAKSEAKDKKEKKDTTECSVDTEKEEDTDKDTSKASIVDEESPTKTTSSGDKLNKVVSTNEEDKEEEKIWADVDKDLGDLLAEVDEPANKSSDEDEEKGGGERYDRFRYSEKDKLKDPDVTKLVELKEDEKDDLLIETKTDGNENEDK